MLKVHQHRQGLARVSACLRKGRLTVGYIGGSISDPRPPYTWPDVVSRWFANRFPGLRVIEENAALGATGSELAVFRAERDLIDRGCDLVLIEFAVNDSGEPAE